MKTYISFLCVLMLLCVGLPVHGGNSGVDIISEADSCYSAENYDKAVELYNKVIAEVGSSSSLYYNLGDAYYRNGELGKAMVSYYRSLRLDPTNDDARQNINFVKSKLVDKVGESGSFFGNMFNSITNQATSNGWAWISVVLFLIVIAGSGCYIFSGNVLLRKIGFFGGILCLLVTVLTISFAIHARNLSVAKDEAVVTVPSTILSTSPRVPKDRNEEAMLLHEGTLVKILDTVTSGSGDKATVWHEVEVDNSHRAWIKSTDIEII